MIIRNATSNKIIGYNAKLCTSVFSKLAGLMLSNKVERALIFKFGKEQKVSLHMLFVFCSIDVLFLDKNKIVVDKKENFKPFSFYISRKKAMYAVELPNGTLKKTNTKIGDKVEIRNNTKKIN